MSSFSAESEADVAAYTENMNERERIIALKIMGVKTGAELIPIINSRTTEGWRSGSRGDEKAATWDRVYHYLFPDPRGNADESDDESNKVFTNALSSWSYPKLSDEEKVMVQHSLILVENKLMVGTDCDYMVPFLTLKKRILGGRRSKILGIGNRKCGVSREVAEEAFDANMGAPSSDPIYQAQVSWQNIQLSYKNCASQIFARGLLYLRKHTTLLHKTDNKAVGLLQKNMTLNRAQRADIEYFWQVASKLSHLEKCQFIRELMFDKTKIPHVMTVAAAVAVTTTVTPAATASASASAKKGKKNKRSDPTEVDYVAAVVEEPLSPASKKGRKGKGTNASVATLDPAELAADESARINADKATANNAKAAMLLAALTAHNNGSNKLSAEQYKAVNEKYMSLLLEL